jgi:adenosylmethionine-8-amino-7-oxononanoate aminotransferase
MSLIDDDKAHVWHPFTQHLTAEIPLEIVRAKGIYIYDIDGRSYIDANSSWWVNVHGHGHPHIAKAITEQFNTLDHVVFAGVTHPKAVELAKRITSKLPENLTKVFFSDNGSTAVEIGLKMAFQYFHNRGEERRKIVAMQGSYRLDNVVISTSHSSPFSSMQITSTSQMEPMMKKSLIKQGIIYRLLMLPY